MTLLPEPTPGRVGPWMKPADLGMAETPPG